LKTQISLFSKDETLVRSLEESIAGGLEGEFTLEVKTPGQVPSSLDLCIWDFIPGETVFPRRISENEWRKHLFLLHRKNLGVLRALVGVSDIHVLLKPVTGAALRAFLGGYGLHRLDPYDDQGHRLTTLRSERDEMLQILMQTNLKLQEFNHERTNFLVRSIHDFRAPLTAISGYCDLLLDEEFEPLTSGQRTLLQRMQHSVRRLSRATNAMLQLSVTESGGAALNVEQADIGDCIGRVLEELGEVFESKRISVTVEVEPSPENLLFDSTRIHQVLVNLLESSCKFTPAKGSIAIKGYPSFWERRNGRAAEPPFAPDRRVGRRKTFNCFRIDINDSGPPIPAVHADKIFEEYTSYSGGQDRSGTGLGMAVCRMILSQHRGRVWAENQATGAVYSFVLPLS
jgi:signal transduction histidine kinase